MSEFNINNLYIFGLIPACIILTVIAVILFYRNKLLKNEAQQTLKQITKTDRISQALILDAEENLKNQKDHNKTLQKAVNQAKLLEEVVVNANDGIIITKADNIDKNGPEIIYVNDAICNITGYDKDELIGNNPRMLQGPNSNRDTLDQIRKCLESKQPFKGEIVNYNKNGEEYWLSISIVPVRNKEGKVTHFAAIERDITEQKTSEIELINAVNKAEKANKAKSEFLANMSHELRTPMNGILGMSSLLKDTQVDDEQKELVDTIYNSGEQLLKQLNDILDISKVESGDVTIEIVPYDIHLAVKELKCLFDNEASSKSLDLNLEIADNIPKCIMGDYTKMMQVMRNLLGNALKFTHEGSVTIQITLFEDPFDDSEAQLTLSVQDTGIGIPEDRLVDIFEKFTQADASTTRKYGGTGLGLAITKQLVELMGGGIGVESDEGRGAKFYIRMPLKLADDSAIAINSEQDIKTEKSEIKNTDKHNMLIVDDHPINRIFAQKLLKKMGFEHIDVAEDGKQALDMISKNKYSLVLMDCQMPEMDGYEATRQLRKQEKDEEHLPVIAVTANAMVGDKEKCINAGMDDYLSKPLKPDALQDALAKWLKTDGSETIEKPQEETKSSDSPIDMAHLEMFTDGDAEEERELFEMFMQQAEISMQELNDSIDDDESWRKAAHKFKGSAANLGANSLASACKSAEQNNDKPKTEKNEMLKAIQEQLKAIEEFIDQHTA